MPKNLMGPLRSRSISQIITERIAEGILTGELRPGQRLPTEEEFAQRIGAGKSSVRIGAFQQRNHEEALVPWTCAYVDALQAQESSRVDELLARERALLMS